MASIAGCWIHGSPSVYIITIYFYVDVAYVFMLRRYSGRPVSDLHGTRRSLDYAYSHHRAQHMIAQGGAAFGRLMASTGTVAGQALGAVAAGAVGGAARLVTGMAAGAASACQGLRALDAPASSTSGVAPNAAPLQRPRALEEYDISDAGSGAAVPRETAESGSELKSPMADMRSMKREMEQLRAENVRLRASASVASAAEARSGFATPDPAAPKPAKGASQSGQAKPSDPAPSSCAAARLDADDSDAPEPDEDCAPNAAQIAAEHEHEDWTMQQEYPLAFIRVILVLFMVILVDLMFTPLLLRRSSTTFSKGMQLGSFTTLPHSSRPAASLRASLKDPLSIIINMVVIRAASEDFLTSPREVLEVVVIIMAAFQRDAGLETALSKIKAVELPQLAWSGGAAAKPSNLEHWVESVGLDLGGLHWHIKRYWLLCLDSVQRAHAQYLQEGPLMRHAARPVAIAPEPFEILSFHAIELRLCPLLLHLAPENAKTMCLSTKLVSTRDILFTACVDAGPGTESDKHAVLERVKGVHNELAEWKFALNRLVILNTSLPDLPIQMAALKQTASKLLECKGKPTKGDPKGGKAAKGDPMSKLGKGKDDAGGKSVAICPHINNLATGCSAGWPCPMRHCKSDGARLEPTDGRCFNCGAGGHDAAACRRPRKPKPPAKAKKGQAEDQRAASARSPSTSAAGADEAGRPAATGKSAAVATPSPLTSSDVSGIVRQELRSLMELAAPASAPAASAPPSRGQPPIVGVVKVSDAPQARRLLAMDGKRWILADTGATHELRGIKSFSDLPECAAPVPLETATGVEEAMMVGDVVYALGEDLQWLFPLGSYIDEMSHDLSWSSSARAPSYPTGEVIALLREKGAIYIEEGDAEFLRDRRRQAKRAVIDERMSTLAAGLRRRELLQEHMEGGHTSVRPDCPGCRGAHGRLRAHHRFDVTTRPEGQLNIDTSGPHPPGRWPSSRPENSAKQAVHFLLGAYVVETPAAKKDRERLESIAQENEFAGPPPPKPEAAVPGESDIGVAPRLDAAVVDDSVEQGTELAKKVVALFGVNSFGDLELRTNHVGLSACVPNSGPSARPGSIAADAEVEDESGMISKTWYFCVPLENLKAASCIHAIESILAQLRMEVEGANICYRIHGGRAGNLTGGQIKRHFGRGIGVAKLRARAMLLSFSDPLDRQALWARAMQHSAHCSRMHAQDRPVKCPAFGAKVCARIKDAPSSTWAERARDAAFLGVDAESKWLIGRKDLTAKRPEQRTQEQEELNQVALHRRHLLNRPALDLRKVHFMLTTASEDHWTTIFDDLPAQTVTEMCFGLRDGSDPRLPPPMRDHLDPMPVAFATAAPEQATLTADDDNAPPEFTKTVKDSGLSIATRAEIARTIGMTREKWRAALESELNSLKDGCLRPLTATKAHSVKPSEILPMKVVAGQKAPDASGYRRFKARGCVRGNFEEVGPAEQTFTQNLDIASLRMALAVRAHRRWSASALDVSTAFLNAFLPVDKKRVVIRPPAIFAKFGPVPAGELWVAERAVYGLRCSPKAWGDLRDAALRKLTFPVGALQCHLEQSAVDSSVWLVKADGVDDVLGYALSYVDDFLFMGPEDVVRALQTSIGALWTTSSQKIISPDRPGTIRYLSIDIGIDTHRLTLSQHEYVNDMLMKWDMAQCNGCQSINPDDEIYMPFAPEDDEEKPDPDDVRGAQRMAGGPLWLSSRTRPDLSHSGSRISSHATRRPRTPLVMGKKVLRYLAAKRQLALVYVLSTPRELQDLICQLDAFSDASHGDAGAQTGVACFMYERMLVDWRSLRQQLVCFSTAEAEMNGLALSCQVLYGLEAVAHAMELETTAVLHGDNQAAKHIAEGRGSWRTRSLMTKDNAIRSRVERGMLELIYAETALMRADGFTKSKGPEHVAKVRAHFGLWGH
ncbi:unnamed protein product [Prorocentrum cordatum]|uniref:CCHC-type domain-containing protein n=1 Tax=Prorocentrum cordatum TaxID=2364126 RepID=A0ABN9TQD5_9DINO|nr:unnamed protein product [Polarella glacialis]